MDAFRFNYQEESRPPETLIKRRCSDNARYNYKYYFKSSPSKKLSMGALSLPPGIQLIDNNSFAAADIQNQNVNSIKSITTLNSDEQNEQESETSQDADSARSDVNFNRITTAAAAASETENAEQCSRTVTSPRRIIKSNSCRESSADRTQTALQTKRPTSLPPEQYRKRSSYHCDVEEALSSLLWQPYEYRSSRSDSSDTLSSTLSSASSSCTSLSLDLAARGMMQSFTDDFLNVTTPLPAQRHSGNNADPNLSLQMVTNLMALKSSAVGALAGQSGRAAQSRGSDGSSSASQVDWERSRECAFVSWSACGVCNTATTITTPLSRDTATGGCRTRCDSAINTVITCVRDDTVLSAVQSDMRVEIPGPGSQPPVQEVAGRKPPDVLQHSGALPQPAGAAGSTHHQGRQTTSGGVDVTTATTNTGVVSVGENGTRAVYMPSNARCSVSTGISSDMIPSNMTSVVSANVVGLPVHSRSSSNLSSSRADIVQPNHPRSASETANSVIVQHQLGGHFRSSSNLAQSSVPVPQSQLPDRNSHTGLIPVPSHPRQSSSGSLQQTRGASEPPINITHSSDVHNMSSVSASVSEHRGTLVPHTSTTDLTHSNYVRSPDTRTVSTEVSVQTTRVPPLPNVSNINVNFYRAVPVNVVSSVPTINCLNSVEDTGNNVSNVHIVQAMPPSIPSVSVAETSDVSVQQCMFARSLEVRTRTFTSTEAQTDDTTVGALVTPTTATSTITTTREQRRRERRERRHQRRLNSTNHQHQHGAQGQQWTASPNDRLPDLLNSHLPPPYTTLPSSMPQSPATTMVPPNNLMPSTVVNNPVVANNIVPFHPGVVPGQVPLVPGPPPVPIPAPSGFRFPFPSAAGFRR